MRRALLPAASASSEVSAVTRGAARGMRHASRPRSHTRPHRAAATAPARTLAPGPPPNADATRSSGTRVHPRRSDEHSSAPVTMSTAATLRVGPVALATVARRRGGRRAGRSRMRPGAHPPPAVAATPGCSRDRPPNAGPLAQQPTRFASRTVPGGRIYSVVVANPELDRFQPPFRLPARRAPTPGRTSRALARRASRRRRARPPHEPLRRPPAR